MQRRIGSVKRNERQEDVERARCRLNEQHDTGERDERFREIGLGLRCTIIYVWKDRERDFRVVKDQQVAEAEHQSDGQCHGERDPPERRTDDRANLNEGGYRRQQRPYAEEAEAHLGQLAILHGVPRWTWMP